MPSFYTVVQYVPDPIADERMNVGVIVCGEEGIKANFLKHWERARRFGGENVSFLKDFADQLTNPQLSLLPAVPKCDEATLRKIVGSWRNSIQFLEPRASLKAPDELLEEVTQRFLREQPTPVVRETYGKMRAVSQGVRKVRAVLGERLEDRILRRIVKSKAPVQGYCGQHRFDIVVQNGHPLFAINALSFEGSDSERLHTAVDAAAFAIIDVKRTSPQFPMAFFAIPPRDGSETYEYAARAFHKLKTPFLTDGEMENWTRKTARRLHLADAFSPD
jgi:DUF3037 family protein